MRGSTTPRRCRSGARPTGPSSAASSATCWATIPSGHSAPAGRPRWTRRDRWRSCTGAGCSARAPGTTWCTTGTTSWSPGGVGEFWGSDYLAAAAAPDGGVAIAYMPTARTVTVDLSRLAKGRANAWWFDPRTGKASAAGTFVTDGPREFPPPAEGDWALVLDDASRRLPAPGL